MASDVLQINVIKQDIIKCDVALKGYLVTIGNHEGDVADLTAMAALVRTKMTQLRSHLASLCTLAQEQEGLSSREAALREVSEHEAALQHTNTAMRNALIKAQLASTEREKSELFSSWKRSGEEDGGGEGVRQRMGRDMALQQSSRLTDDLLTATRMIQQNTDKSALTIDKLVESSQTIGSTQEELKTMGSVISQARKILSKYGRRENTDKLLIFLGLVFFAACCLVVMRNRLNFL